MTTKAMLQQENDELRQRVAVLEKQLANYTDRRSLSTSPHDNTERKQAESQREKVLEKLRESERRYTTLFQRSGIPVVLIKLPETVIADANESAEKLLGYRRKEIIGKTSAELGLISQSQRTATIAHFQTKGRLEENEIRITTKDGVERVITFNTHPIEINGQPFAFTSFQDITERKSMEIKNARLTERFDLAAHSAGIGIWDWDIQKNEIDWDDQMYALYGLPPGEFGGAYEAWLRGVHPDDRDPSNEVSAAAVRGEREYDTEFRVLWHDGSVHWLKANGQVFRDEQGNPTRMVGVNYDITERKQTEEKLQESEIKFRALFENSPLQGVIWKLIRDLQGEIVDWEITDINPLGAVSIGLQPEEAIGKRAMDLFGGEAMATYLEASRQIAASGKPLLFETHFDANGRDYLSSDFLVGSEHYANISMDITERKQAENKLRESEIRLRQSQHIAHIGSWEWNLHTGETRWSPENYVLHGLSPDAPTLTPDMLLKYVHPDDLERVTTVISQAVSAGSSVELDYRIFRADGELRVIHAVGEVTEFNAEGKPLLMLGTNQDITERKQAEAELIESEMRFSTAFFTSPVSQSIIAQETSEILAVNDACCRLFGYNREELLGLSTASLGLWENPADRLAAVEELQRTGRLTAREAIARKKSGEIHTIIVAIEPISWKGRSCFISSLFDITDRKTMERLLQENERKYRELVENANSVIIRWKSDGTIVFFNEFAQEFFGYRLNEILGKPVSILVPQTDSTGGDLSMLAQSIVDHPDQFVNVVNENICNDGRRAWMVWTNKPIYNEQSRVAEILAVGVDITERKHMEDELRRSNAELEQFAYIASHDLQEPLRTVAGMVQLLQKRYEGQLDERADEYIGHAVESASRMQALIRDLLAYSRVTRKNQPIAETRMQDCLQIALKNLGAAIQESHAEITAVDLPTVHADPTQLTQLFQNLIGNSLKFRGERAPRVHISATQLNGFWQFTVQDNGIGIEPQYFERIFLVFQRLHTRRQYQGTGIGLALCKKIIERHGGSIWVESQPGTGSTFYFTLPIRSIT